MVGWGLHVTLNPKTCLLRQRIATHVIQDAADAADAVFVESEHIPNDIKPETDESGVEIPSPLPADLKLGLQEYPVPVPSWMTPRRSLKTIH